MGSRGKRAGTVVAAALALPLLAGPAASAAGGYKTCSGGQLAGGQVTHVSVLADQVIKIKVHNHDYRGLAVTIHETGFDKQLWKGIVAPGKTKTVRRGVFGERPILHKIGFEVTSRLSNNYTYKIQSKHCY